MIKDPSLNRITRTYISCYKFKNAELCHAYVYTITFDNIFIKQSFFEIMLNQEYLFFFNIEPHIAGFYEINLTPLKKSFY